MRGRSRDPRASTLGPSIKYGSKLCHIQIYWTLLLYGNLISLSCLRHKKDVDRFPRHTSFRMEYSSEVPRKGLTSKELPNADRRASVYPPELSGQKNLPFRPIVKNCFSVERHQGRGRGKTNECKCADSTLTQD